jgi:transcriptional regulator with XRE-family HTH domain
MRSRLALHIQRLRVARGWSVAELAERAELSPTIIAQLESGHPLDIGLDELWHVAEALGVDVGVLVQRPVAH